MKFGLGGLSVEASEEEVASLKGPLIKLWQRREFKTVAFFGALALLVVYLEAPVASKDQTAQNPNCRILINSFDSSYTNNGQVLGPGACMNSQGDRFDGNGSIAGKPN